MAKGNSITEQIPTQLRSDIVNCYYDAHALITEGEVSERFQVSKTPTREALNYLCQEGLVEKLPHRGYLVKGFSMRDLENLFQFRRILKLLRWSWPLDRPPMREIEEVRRLAQQRVPPGETNLIYSITS